MHESNPGNPPQPHLCVLFYFSTVFFNRMRDTLPYLSSLSYARLDHRRAQSGKSRLWAGVSTVFRSGKCANACVCDNCAGNADLITRQLGIRTQRSPQTGHAAIARGEKRPRPLLSLNSHPVVLPFTVINFGRFGWEANHTDRAALNLRTTVAGLRTPP